MLAQLSIHPTHLGSLFIFLMHTTLNNTLYSLELAPQASKKVTTGIKPAIS